MPSYAPGIVTDAQAVTTPACARPRSMIAVSPEAEVNAHLVGALAGVATSGLWVLTSLFFTEGGRRIGSTVVNALRLVIAIALHGLTFRLIAGAWWPQVGEAQLLYLAASGILGLAVCDQALFTAFVDIGPRLALLAMTTSPVWAAIFGLLGMGERLGVADVAGITITVIGVAWVVLERTPGSVEDAQRPHYWRGMILALLAAVLQAAGMLLSKKGMGHGVDGSAAVSAQGATYIRLVFGALGMAPILAAYAFRRRTTAHASAMARRIGRRSIGYAFTLAGAIVGPYLGVWMSLIAVDNMPVGIAQTLCSLSPVLILPVVIVVYRESVSWRAAIGAAVAVAGSSMLVLVGSG